MRVLIAAIAVALAGVFLTTRTGRDDGELEGKGKAVRYEDGDGSRLFTTRKNAFEFEWKTKSGSLSRLEQHMKVGRHQVEADFDAKKNRTTIESEHPEGKAVRPGLVLLGLATTGGRLSIEY